VVVLGHLGRLDSVLGGGISVGIAGSVLVAASCSLSANVYLILSSGSMRDHRRIRNLVGLRDLLSILVRLGSCARNHRALLVGEGRLELAHLLLVLNAGRDER